MKIPRILTVFLASLIVSGCAYTPIQPAAAPRRASLVDPTLVASSIRSEKPNYDKQYIIGAYDITTACEKVTNAPKYKVIEICTDIKIAYQRLRMLYPQYNASTIDLYLLTLTSKVDGLRENIKIVDATQDGYRHTQAEYAGALNSLNEIKVLLQELRPMISGMESGLAS